MGFNLIFVVFAALSADLRPTWWRLCEGGGSLPFARERHLQICTKVRASYTPALAKPLVVRSPIAMVYYLCFIILPVRIAIPSFVRRYKYTPLNKLVTLIELLFPKPAFLNTTFPCMSINSNIKD